MSRIKSSIIFLLLISLSFFASAEDAPRIDNIPMYGQPEIIRADDLKKADEDFIKKVVEGFGTREAASKAWWAQAEKFMQKQDFDFAMRRYNQSWLLNPNNYQPYWGFGRVMLEQGKPTEAIKHLEKSKELIDDQYQKVALLADIGTTYTTLAESGNSEEKSRLFKLANTNFSETMTLGSSYSNGWRRWAMSLYEQGDYSGAWEKVKAAKSSNASPFPPAFLRALEEKLLEPQ